MWQRSESDEKTNELSTLLAKSPIATYAKYIEISVSFMKVPSSLLFLTFLDESLTYKEDMIKIKVAVWFLEGKTPILQR